MSNTARLNLPLIAAAQAQKHVTHNEALVGLDALVHLAVESRTTATPPSSPAAGARYLLPASPAGAWAGHAGAIAVEDGGSWTYLQPQSGWMAYARDEAQTIVFNGTVWSPILINRPARAVFGSLAVGPQADANNLCEVRKDQDSLTEVRILNGNASNNAIVRLTQAIGRPNAYTITDIKDNSGNPYWQLACGTGIVDAYFDMPRFHFRDASGSEMMSIASSGNVGVGTTTPNVKLQVRTASQSADGFSLESAAAGGNFTFRPNMGPGTGNPIIQTGDSGIFYSSSSGIATGALVICPWNASPSGMRLDGSGNVSIGSSSANGKLDVAGIVVPHTDNSYSLGTGTYRWSVVYAATSSINVSDARAKTPVRPLDERECAAARDMRNEIGAFQFLESVAKKGADKARLHIGMTVQRAVAIMQSHDLDPWRYAMFCRDDVTIKTTIKRVESVQTTRDIEEEYFEIELRDALPVRVKKTRVVREPVFEQKPVVDESGRPAIEMRPVLDDSGATTLDENGAAVLAAVPVLHPVPVMEEIETDVEVDEPDGDRLGFRTDQLLLFMLRGLA